MHPPNGYNNYSNKDNNKCCKTVERWKTCVLSWQDCKAQQPLWKTVWEFLKMLNTELPYDLATLLWGIHPRELKTYAHPKTRGYMLSRITVLAKKNGINPNAHQLKNGKQILAHQCNQISCSHEKDEGLPLATPSVSLENIMLSEWSQIQRTISCMISLILKLE